MTNNPQVKELAEESVVAGSSAVDESEIHQISNRHQNPNNISFKVGGQAS
jgi:hypothetical protein